MGAEDLGAEEGRGATAGELDRVSQGRDPQASERHQVLHGTQRDGLEIVKRSRDESNCRDQG